jgi:hypothetical protein
VNVVVIDVRLVVLVRCLGIGVVVVLRVFGILGQKIRKLGFECILCLGCVAVLRVCYASVLVCL